MYTSELQVPEKRIVFSRYSCIWENIKCLVTDRKNNVDKTSKSPSSSSTAVLLHFFNCQSIFVNTMIA